MDTVGIFSVAKEMSKVGGQFFNSFIKLFLNKIESELRMLYSLPWTNIYLSRNGSTTQKKTPLR